MWVVTLAPPRKPVNNYEDVKFNVKKPTSADLDVFSPCTDAPEVEKVQQAWLEGVLCDGFVRTFTEASERNLELKATLLMAMGKFLEIAVPFVELLPGTNNAAIKTAVLVFQGLMCFMSSVPRMWGANYESFKFVCSSDLARAPIIKALPRGVGRIIVTTVKTKWSAECDAYQQAAGAEASVGDELWVTQQAMQFLEDQQTVNGVYLGKAKEKLQHILLHLSGWQASLRAGACSGLEAVIVDVVRRLVTADALQQ